MRMTQSIALKLPLAILSALAVLGSSAFGAGGGSCLVYVGTYTSAVSKGIYAWRMDNATGALTNLGLVAETPNPTYIEIAPNNRFLYAVNEMDTFEGKPAGAVSAFSIDAATGKLTFLNQQTSGGAGPCHLTLDRGGKNVLVANYGGGSIESIAVQPDGHLGAPTAFFQNSGKGVRRDRQEGPHAHCMALDPANHFAFACDLGLDKVFTYRFDATDGKLTPSQPAFTHTIPAAGPRHLVFHPDGKQAYVINELNSTIARFSYDPATGVLNQLQTVPLLPADFTGASTAAEIAVHPSGKFLYGSNRGDDSIAVFGVDAATGNLTFLQRVSTQGKTPRDFTIDPSGKLLFAANQNTGNIVLFNLDPATGKLTPSGKVLECPAPVCVKFVPAP
jgi:6-phosphogluconolactonase